MPLKRSSSLAVPFAHGGKGAKGIPLTGCSEDWATTLALLSNMPRAHYIRRPRNNFGDAQNNSNSSKNKTADRKEKSSVDKINSNNKTTDRRQRSSSDSKNTTIPVNTSNSNSSNKTADRRQRCLSDSSNWGEVCEEHPRRNSYPPKQQQFHQQQHKQHKQQHHHRQVSTSTHHQSSLKLSSREVHVKALGELQTAAARLPHPEVVYGAMIPEPDYSDDERETTVTKQNSIITRNNQVNASSPAKKDIDGNSSRVDENGLIMPKKLTNPCLESTEKKSLHRELLYNQKRGVNVLNQKSELQKAMEKHNDKKVLKEIQKEKEAALTPFQKALDERAQKMEQVEKAEMKDAENEKAKCEFQKIHAKVRAKMEVQ